VAGILDASPEAQEKAAGILSRAADEIDALAASKQGGE
jgi:hypothetical protein